MRFCTHCAMPDSRPDLDFDENGVCDACLASQRKYGQHADSIDWEERRHQFETLIETYRSNDPMKYDCLIGVSGGKDSTYQVYVAKEMFGLNPLCLCIEPTLPTEIGRKNLQNIREMGVDLIHFKQNPIVYEKLILEGFRRVGDPEWANHMAIWSLPFRFAVAHDVPLILWGESPQMEYGGFHRVQEKNMREMDEDWLNDFGCLNGLRPEDMVGDELGITLEDMKPYRMPPKEKLRAVGGNKGCVAAFIGYFLEWNVPKQLKIIEERGFRRRLGRNEITYTDYEGLDCYSMQVHDYLKYCKFGYGRATDDACRDVRDGVIGRDEAVRLASRYDGGYPKELVERFCAHFSMPQEEFDDICDTFTNPAIFEMEKGKFVRDIDGSLVLRQEISDARRNPWVDWGIERPASA
jgi:N-acetyl sugar amidotransferase